MTVRNIYPETPVILVKAKRRRVLFCLKGNSLDTSAKWNLWRNARVDSFSSTEHGLSVSALDSERLLCLVQTLLLTAAL